MPVTEVGVVDLGWRWRDTKIGRLYALIPLPVDADVCLAEAGLHDFADSDDEWHDDIDEVISLTLKAAIGTSDAHVVAPLRRKETPISRLVRFLRFRRAPTTPAERLNPDSLGAANALRYAVRDDQYLQFASVEADHACIQASEGYPILWVWVVGASIWHAVEESLGSRWPIKVLTIDMSRLGPPTRHSKDAVVVDAVENRVMWTDGRGNVLALGGEFLFPHPGDLDCHDPRKVFVPSAGEWSRRAPPWAIDAYTTIMDDLKKYGLNVSCCDDTRTVVMQLNSEIG
ncbi:MAG: hypothetical protein BWY17_03406 [Deltaproteobacteria bacterium ADurb.Bin207]|nr:MAG: hypothetical protein BWY17_03406 [Deltaproteobacteria bacterium ADurb.Bin207]